MYTNIVILLCKVYIVQLPLINLAYMYTQPLRKVCQVRCKHSGSYILHLCMYPPLCFLSRRHLAKVEQQANLMQKNPLLLNA